MTPVLFKCKICNTKFKCLPNNLLKKNTGCPKCNASRSNGERLITKILNKKEIIFNEEYKVLYNGHKHFYDFFIPSKNIFIEYDGKQHYYIVDFSNKNFKRAKEQFNIRQIRDAEKDMWCFINGYELIRIPYTMSDKDIEKLLTERLCN